MELPTTSIVVGDHSRPRWVHFSDAPIREACTTEQADRIASFSKPKGLWVSDENALTSWSAWCVDNDFREVATQVAHAVEFAADAKLLHLSIGSELRAFTDAYLAAARPGPGIDWRAVSREWHGLLITPYLWSERLDVDWYYGWDCASGCVWHADAIASIRPLSGAEATS